MSKHFDFFIPGNLILLGEYFVLNGCPSPCLPTKNGQRFKADQSTKRTWRSYNFKKEVYFNRQDFERVPLIGKLIDRLHTGSRSKMKGTFATESFLDYPFEWGLGSSATTILGFSQIYGLDPFEVYSFFENGSGYDVAVSNAQKPIIYKKNHSSLPWNVSSFLKDHLYFFPLGHKVNSQNEVEKFKLKDSSKHTSEMEKLIEEFINLNCLDKLNNIMYKHDQILSKILKKKSLKEEFFTDYKGQVKYLGSWGGDFAMASTWQDERSTREYFLSKNIKQVYSYKDFIKDE